MSQPDEQQKQSQAQTSSDNSQILDELQQCQLELNEVKKKLERYQLHISQLQWELEQSQSLVYETYNKFELSQSQLNSTQKELKDTKSENDRIKAELEESKFQLKQSQDRLQFTNSQREQTEAKLKNIKLLLQFQAEIIEDSNLKNSLNYTKLLWDAWEAHQNSNLNQMAQCLEISFQFSPFSRTKTISNWLNTFSKFSSETGQKFDTYSLTNSPEWQKLISRNLKPRHGRNLFN